MANEIKSSLLDIKTYHKNTLDVLELGNFRSLLSNIESRTFTAHGKLMAWKKTKHLRGGKHETKPPEDTNNNMKR